MDKKWALSSLGSVTWEQGCYGMKTCWLELPGVPVPYVQGDTVLTRNEIHKLSLDLISGAFCSREWCYSCVSLILCPSMALVDLKAQAMLQNSFLAQKPQQLLLAALPGIASDILSDRAPGLGLVFPHPVHLPGWSRAGSWAVVPLHTDTHERGFIHEPWLEFFWFVFPGV